LIRTRFHTAGVRSRDHPFARTMSANPSSEEEARLLAEVREGPTAEIAIAAGVFHPNCLSEKLGLGEHLSFVGEQFP
jgi:hypothetical protein